MFNNKGLLFLFLIQNTSKGYTYLKKTVQEQTHSPKNPSIKKAGVCFLSMQLHHTSLPMHVASIIHERGQQNHVHFNPISFKFFKNLITQLFL